ANSKLDHAINIFRINQFNGDLEFMAYEKADEAINPLMDLESISHSPDGKYLYVTSNQYGSLFLFERNLTNGLITLVKEYSAFDEGFESLHATSDLEISKDGNHIYISSQENNSIAVFNRNIANGQLVFVQEVSNRNLRINSLNHCIDIQLSNDNQFLYALGAEDNALVSFKRNPLSGQLEYLGSIKGVELQDQMLYPNRLSISEDDQHLFVCGLRSNSLCVFEIESNSGRPSFAYALSSSDDLPYDLYMPYTLSYDNANQLLYVGAIENESLNLFKVDDGNLQWVQTIFNEDASAKGLALISEILINQAGSDIYTLDQKHDAIAHYRNSLVTNTNHLQDLIDIRIFPNPLSENLHIGGQVSNDRIDLYSSNGKFISSI
ncbi:MAG: beta-propeller fold lactonase family protein, partial [Bacteroidota bacterium]